MSNSRAFFIINVVFLVTGFLMTLICSIFYPDSPVINFSRSLYSSGITLVPASFITYRTHRIETASNFISKYRDITSKIMTLLNESNLTYEQRLAGYNKLVQELIPEKVEALKCSAFLKNDVNTVYNLLLKETDMVCKHANPSRKFEELMHEMDKNIERISKFE